MTESEPRDAALAAWREAHPSLSQWYDRACAMDWPEDAAEIPELLRGLTDPSEIAREHALVSLFDCAVVDEELTDVAAPLVPLIFELLGAGDVVPDKDQLLVAVDELADVGAALLEEAEAIAALAEEGVEIPPEARPPSGAELARARAVRDAVIAGADAMLALLDDEDPDTRVCAAYALTEPLTARAKEIAEALLARLAVESEPAVRASLLLALGLSTHSPVIETIRARLDQAEDALEKLAAAMALIPFFGKLVEDDALLTLIEALADPDDLRLAYGELPWADVDMVVDLGGVLASFNDDGVCPVLVPLLERLRRCDTRTGQGALISAALTVVFDEVIDLIEEGPELVAEAIADQGGFTPPQHELLVALAEDDRLWGGPLDVGELLDEIGLPHERETLREALRSDADA